MGVLDFLKGKKQTSSLDRELEIPPAPPTLEELPELPSPKEIHKVEIKKAVEEPPVSVVEDFEERAVEKQEEELDMREDLALKKPIFMPIELFRDILEEVGMIAHTLKENTDTLVRVSHFKEDEDKEFKKWESQVNEIQRKLIYVDKTLFGQKG